MIIKNQTIQLIWMCLLLTACVKPFTPTLNNPEKKSNQQSSIPPVEPIAQPQRNIDPLINPHTMPKPKSDDDAYHFAMEFARQALEVEKDSYTKALDYYVATDQMLEHLETQYPDSKHLKTIKQRLLQSADAISYDHFRQRLLEQIKIKAVAEINPLECAKFVMDTFSGMDRVFKNQSIARILSFYIDIGKLEVAYTWASKNMSNLANKSMELANIADHYAKAGNHTKALSIYKKAFAILNVESDGYLMINFMFATGAIALGAFKYDLPFAKRVLQFAEQYQFAEQSQFAGQIQMAAGYGEVTLGQISRIARWYSEIGLNDDATRLRVFLSKHKRGMIYVNSIFEQQAFAFIEKREMVKGFKLLAQMEEGIGKKRAQVQVATKLLGFGKKKLAKKLIRIIESEPLPRYFKTETQIDLAVLHHKLNDLPKAKKILLSFPHIYSKIKAVGKMIKDLSDDAAIEEVISLLLNDPEFTKSNSEMASFVRTLIYRKHLTQALSLTRRIQNDCKRKNKLFSKIANAQLKNGKKEAALDTILAYKDDADKNNCAQQIAGILTRDLYLVGKEDAAEKILSNYKSNITLNELMDILSALPNKKDSGRIAVDYALTIAKKTKYPANEAKIYSTIADHFEKSGHPQIATEYVTHFFSAINRVNFKEEKERGYEKNVTAMQPNADIFDKKDFSLNINIQGKTVELKYSNHDYYGISLIIDCIRHNRFDAAYMLIEQIEEKTSAMDLLTFVGIIYTAKGESSTGAKQTLHKFIRKYNTDLHEQNINLLLGKVPKKIDCSKANKKACNDKKIKLGQSLKNSEERTTRLKLVELLKALCAQGHHSECAELGYLFEDGTGVQKDYFAALHYYQKNAESDKAWGNKLIGELYLKGKLGTPDYPTAEKHYTLACDANSISSCVQLGKLKDRSLLTSNPAIKSKSKSNLTFKSGDIKNAVLIKSGYYKRQISPSKQKKIYLKSFYIDKDKVSILQYQHCLRQGACSMQAIDGFQRWLSLYYQSLDWSSPIYNVTWFEANEYCQFVGKRLPTEAEWEKAAQGKHFNHQSHQINQQPLSPTEKDDNKYNVHIILKSMGEFVSDWFNSKAKPKTNRNPSGPKNGLYKIIKGEKRKGYLRKKDLSPIFDRKKVNPHQAYNGVGFRCAMGVPKK